MKHINMLILLVCALGCKPTGIDDPEKRNENWCWFVDKTTGEGKWVPVSNETTLPDGDYTLFFCNGGIRQTGKLKDQKDCDTIFYYDLNGKNISKVFALPDSTLLEFMPDGKYKSYFATCEISGEGEFKNNKQIGVRKEYYRNGKIKFKSIADNDTIWAMNYYESGQIEDSTMVIQGKYEGIRTKWYESGQIESQRTFKNGAEFGTSISFYPNGQIDQKGSWYDGLPDDTIIDWFESGKMKFIRYYIKGKKQGSSKVWYENGNIHVTVAFKENKKHGQYNEYYENGSLKTEGEYNNGQKIGAWKYYDLEGKLTGSN